MTFARLMAFSAIAMLTVASSAHALDFKTIGSNPAVFYDAPSEKGRKVFVAPRGMPLEVVLTQGSWVKVRDAGGDLAWVESKWLSPKRNVVVNAANTKILAAAEDNAFIVFMADKGVLLELVEPAAPGWLKVKHRDGQSGFAKAADVWGE